MPIGLYQWVEQTFGRWQPTSVTKWISTFLHPLLWLDKELLWACQGQCQDATQDVLVMCTGKQASLFHIKCYPNTLPNGVQNDLSSQFDFQQIWISWFSYTSFLPFSMIQRTTTNPWLCTSQPSHKTVHLPSILAPKQRLAHFVEVDRQQRSVFTEGSTLAGKIVVIPYWPAGPWGWYHLSLSSPTINKNPCFKLPIQAGAH